MQWVVAEQWTVSVFNVHKKTLNFAFTEVVVGIMIRCYGEEPIYIDVCVFMLISFCALNSNN